MFKFRPKLPKALNRTAMFAVILKYMDYLADEIKYDFEQTVRTWEEKPEFKVTAKKGLFQIKIKVETYDQVYMWVSRGTEPHPIDAVNAEHLAFRYGGFEPKTAPDRIEAKQGRDDGDWVFPKHVEHPGIEPRNFDKQIQEKWEGIFAKYLESMFAEVAKNSGHSLDVSLHQTSMYSFHFG